MTIKEIAKSFGMNVNTLVSLSGYSKQGLYDVVKNKCNRDNERFNAFIEHLSFKRRYSRSKDTI